VRWGETGNHQLLEEAFSASYIYNRIKEPGWGRKKKKGKNLGQRTDLFGGVIWGEEKENQRGVTRWVSAVSQGGKGGEKTRPLGICGGYVFYLNKQNHRKEAPKPDSSTSYVGTRCRRRLVDGGKKQSALGPSKGGGKNNEPRVTAKHADQTPKQPTESPETKTRPHSSKKTSKKK